MGVVQPVVCTLYNRAVKGSFLGGVALTKALRQGFYPVACCLSRRLCVSGIYIDTINDYYLIINMNIVIICWFHSAVICKCIKYVSILSNHFFAVQNLHVMTSR